MKILSKEEVKRKRLKILTNTQWEFCWFYTCFEQKRNPKMVIYIITIAGLFSRKMAHILNQSLFRKKRFEINFFVRQNASKFAIFIEKENPNSFFVFHFE